MYLLFFIIKFANGFSGILGATENESVSNVCA